MSDTNIKSARDCEFFKLNDTLLAGAEIEAKGSEPVRSLLLDIEICDPEVITEFLKHQAGDARNRYALSALKVGVMALRHASGSVDGETIRQEGARLLGDIRQCLTESSGTLVGELKASLQQYFDPTTGHLPERLNRFVKSDGDLDRLLRSHLAGDTSTIAQSLALKIGETSPIFKLLSPTQSDGLINTLQTAVQTALDQQREHIVGQFSLNDENSALSRFRKEITDSNGELTRKMTEDLDAVRNEFSLDNADGALARLVGRVEAAQTKIAEEFSLDSNESALSRISSLLQSATNKIDSSLTLDDENSALSRIRRELLGVINAQSEKNATFQKDVCGMLESAKARKEELARSTHGGTDFETAVCEFVQSEVQRLGDVFEPTGATTGNIKMCKVGDGVITLGPDCAAAGCRLVVEAKREAGYTLQEALTELKKAKTNRAAQIGVFVFSKASAPDALEPLTRYGSEIVAVWDNDDPQTDVILRAAISLAKALAVRERAAEDAMAEDLAEVDGAIQAFEKTVTELNDACTWANTIQSNSGKIIKAVENVRSRLPEHIATLTRHVQRLRVADGSS